VAGGDQPARLGVAYHLRQTPDVGGHHWHARRQRLERRQTKALLLAGQHEEVRLSEEPTHLKLLAEEGHVAGHSERDGELFHQPPFGPVPHQQKRRRTGLEHLGERGDGITHALDGPEVGGVQKHGRPDRPIPLQRGEEATEVGAVVAGMKLLGVDEVGDDLHLLGLRQGEIRHSHLSQPDRRCGHRVAPHHRMPSNCAQRGVTNHVGDVGSVKGGHQPRWAYPAGDQHLLRQNCAGGVGQRIVDVEHVQRLAGSDVGHFSGQRQGVDAVLERRADDCLDAVDNAGVGRRGQTHRGPRREDMYRVAPARQLQRQLRSGDAASPDGGKASNAHAERPHSATAVGPLRPAC
jgi:hypothetical protein